ncbi:MULTISPECIES: PTS sugar transporter subunit IIC [Halanaerobium]|jgi:PTS system cellobiose-specific IIC component|uniref:Permease IIC component n=1 Tax=Halanaerobium congolense TaxID=54121 RepID=A0A4R8G4C6_9FIRM|nr:MULTISPECIES: PTS sugar transporter subunit IIC [Halanaerobium]PUU89594.1 MAG: PTS system, cellobiose-specific IIC component [Halanaerobium sp.]TDX37575.1 PTS system cellobiose-specific IIC component [Halanaerobium congolense]
MKNKLFKILEDKFLPVAGKVGEQRHLQAIRDGLIAILPMLIIGSVALIVAFPPIPFLAELVAPYVDRILMIQNATFGLMALLASFTISYSLSKKYSLPPLESALLGLSSFVLLVPLTENGNLTLSWLGSDGLFIAILVALYSVEVQRFIVEKDITIKMPKTVPPNVARSFSALIPVFIVLLSVWVFNQISLTFASISIPELINNTVTAPLLLIGGTFPGVVVLILAISIFWFVGIHGSSLVIGTAGPVLLTLLDQNTNALSAGAEVLPNIVNQPFLEIFINMGGSGSTFVLALLLVFAAKSKQFKAIGKTAIGPGLFNINEPIIFGMPIVMNPVMLIPFILAPLSAAAITYAAMALELVARPYTLIPWTTPPLISGFLATGDWRAIILQIVTMTVAGLIYYPFMKILDEKNLADEKAAGEVEEEAATA